MYFQSFTSIFAKYKEHKTEQTDVIIRHPFHSGSVYRKVSACVHSELKHISFNSALLVLNHKSNHDKAEVEKCWAKM